MRWVKHPVSRAEGGALLDPLDPKSLAAVVADALAAGEVFSEVIVGPGGERLRPDYILELEVRGRGITAGGSEATSKAILSTVLWLFFVVPGWWVDDRVYPESDLQFYARFFPADGPPGRAILTEVFDNREVHLDLVRRGALRQFFLSLVLPSFWMEDLPTAERSLKGEAFRRLRDDLAERVRDGWPAAALAGPPGCLLVLDPPAAHLETVDGGVDVRGWLAARSPLEELKVLDERGQELLRLDRKTLSALALKPPPRALPPPLAERLGEAAGLVRVVYPLDLEGVPAGGGGRIRLEALAVPSAPALPVAARFTIPCR